MEVKRFGSSEKEFVIAHAVAVVRAELCRGEKVLTPKGIRARPATHTDDFLLRAFVDPDELVVSVRPFQADGRSQAGSRGFGLREEFDKPIDEAVRLLL